MVLAFPIIRKFLAWRGGNGCLVRVGSAAVMGCVNYIFINVDLIHG